MPTVPRTVEYLALPMLQVGVDPDRQGTSEAGVIALPRQSQLMAMHDAKQREHEPRQDGEQQRVHDEGQDVHAAPRRM